MTFPAGHGEMISFFCYTEVRSLRKSAARIPGEAGIEKGLKESKRGGFGVDGGFPGSVHVRVVRALQSGEILIHLPGG
jgi:hypothetical protein